MPPELRKLPGMSVPVRARPDKPEAKTHEAVKTAGDPRGSRRGLDLVRARDDRPTPRASPAVADISAQASLCLPEKTLGLSAGPRQCHQSAGPQGIDADPPTRRTSVERDQDVRTTSPIHESCAIKAGDPRFRPHTGRHQEPFAEPESSAALSCAHRKHEPAAVVPYPTAVQRNAVARSVAVDVRTHGASATSLRLLRCGWCNSSQQEEDRDSG